jgi:hypothetical protein
VKHQTITSTIKIAATTPIAIPTITPVLRREPLFEELEELEVVGSAGFGTPNVGLPVLVSIVVCAELLAWALLLIGAFVAVAPTPVTVATTRIKAC